MTALDHDHGRTVIPGPAPEPRAPAAEQPSPGEGASSTSRAALQVRPGLTSMLLKERLNDTRKVALRTKGKAGAAARQLAELRTVLGDILRDARLGGEITDHDEQSAIHGIDQLLTHSPAVEEALQSIVKHTDGLGKLGEQESWSAWAHRQTSDLKSRATDAINPRAAGAVCMGLAAMAAKNGAWYLPSLLSSSHVPFESVSGMAKLFFERWALANTAAGAAEYPASVISQRIFKATGNSMNEFLAVTQLGDMVSAYAAMKLTGQQVSAYEGLGLASVAVAALIRTGTLSKVWDRFAGHGEAAQLAPIQLGAPHGNDTDTDTERDLEGQRPSPVVARADAKRIQQLFEKIPDATWAARMSNVKGLMADLDELRASEQSARSVTGAVQSRPDATEIGGLEKILEHIEQELRNPAFDALSQALASISGRADDARTPSSLDGLREHLKAFKEDLEKTGGKDPKTIGFAVGMLTAYAVPVILGNVGQLTSSGALKSVVTRGALNIMGSVSAQTAANLGHHLLEEKEGDSALWKHIKSTGVAIGLTPTEFIPLVLGLLYMDKATDMASASHDKPAWPTTGSLRVFQELGRAFYSTLFTHLTLGTAVSRDDIAGLLVQLGGAGLAAGLDYREQAGAQTT